mgnify:CR=1 FL=1
MEKNSAEISQDITETEKEYSKALEGLQVVEEAILLLQKDIIDKQSKKKDLEYSCSKAKYNVRQLNIKLRILRASFWSANNSGL